MKTLLTFLVLTAAGVGSYAQGSLERALIPYPLHVKNEQGTFTLSRQTVIRVPAEDTALAALAGALRSDILRSSAIPLTISRRATPGSREIRLLLDLKPDTLGNEGYHLSASAGGVIIRANTPQGLFYGIQTFKQLLPLKKKGAVSIPSVTITDRPRFPWRGLMLDAGRYFYSVDFIKKLLDYMAMYKLNTFHWHLTEDHGWRIEIKKYPRLTDIGAWRGGTQYDRSPGQIDKNPHGGYYTQQQVREVVAYAAARYINVVPEIEMPGHSLAALVAYPELSCTGGPFKMPLQWGIQKDVYCAGNEQTFRFLEDVLSEVTALFPSPYIHIGGDECPKDRWKTCPKCQARMKAEGLQDEHELQSYFIRRIENFLQGKHKRIIGWDEILEGGLAPNATVMSWRGIQGGIAAARQHHQVIMTPSESMYLDFYQGAPYLEPVAIGGYLPLQKVYHYEPVPPTLSPEEGNYIQGLQANVWSEYIHSPEKVEYMTFPRAAAMAEVAWTARANKNWEDFKKRIETEYERYDQLGIHYARSAYQVTIDVEADTSHTKAQVRLSTDSARPEIRYTKDGTDPTPTSTLYTGPFETGLPATVKASTFRNGKPLAGTSACTINPAGKLYETQP